MAKQLFLNNFTTVFIAAVKQTPTTGTPATELDYGVLRVSDGAAGMLLNPTGGDYYVLTAYKRSGSTESNIEVMRVTAVDNATPGECRITVQRAQEGTTAQAYVSGDYLSLRFTKGSAENMVQKVAGKGLSTEDYTTAEKSKLAGVAAGATANSTDAQLRDRATHTGTQAISSVSGLQDALNAKANSASPTFDGDVVLNMGPGSQGISDASGTVATLQVKAPSGTSGAFMSFHRPGVFAAHFGIDTDNKLKIGGWSLGATAYSIYHEGYKPTKTDVGLGNVDNTSDANKPISTATQAALDGKQASLGFTPVQQGGVTGQGPNKVYIGWAADASGLLSQVDNTNFGNSWPINITKNAATATKLATASTLTIGSTGKSFDGSAALSWSVAEIGAASTTTPTITGLREVRTALPANNIDLATGNVFTKTISGATTLTVSNVPATGTTASFILDLTNGGSAAITWWAGMKWAGGTVPTLTAAGRDVLGFFTHDGGTTWTGLVLGKDVK